MNRIKELRKEKKLSQEKLAEELGVQKLTIWRWEHDSSAMTVRTVKKVADYFGVSASYLLNLPEPEKENNLVIDTTVLKAKILKDIEKIDITELERLKNLAFDLFTDLLLFEYDRKAKKDGSS